MKILMATDTDVFPYGVGGVKRFVTQLATHLGDAGAQVEVVCARTNDAPLVEADEPPFQLTRLPVPGGRLGFRARFRVARSIARFMRATLRSSAASEPRSSGPGRSRSRGGRTWTLCLAVRSQRNAKTGSTLLAMGILIQQHHHDPPTG